MPDGTPTTADPGPSAIARRRREQIVAAAEAIIAAEGLPKLSLGRIEQRTKMSRGQLTYYFRTKEAILLAVFDRMLARMVAQIGTEPGAPVPGTGRAWECLRYGFRHKVGRAENKDFLSLLYTFLAQMGHRPDYRKKVAEANDHWRAMLTHDVATSVPADSPVPPRVVACLLMALINGLTMQLAADPQAFDRAEMAAAVERLMAPLFGVPDPDSARSES